MSFKPAGSGAPVQQEETSSRTLQVWWRVEKENKKKNKLIFTVDQHKANTLDLLFKK